MSALVGARSRWLFLLATGMWFAATTARAGGLELAGAGARALARGGATVANVQDPMVLRENPAGLADLDGRQFLSDLTLPFAHACVTPIGYYGWGVYRGGDDQPFEIDGQVTSLEPGDPYFTEPLGRVCLAQSYLPIPELVASFRLARRWGIGVGLVFPNLAPQGRWGDEHGTIENAAGERRPARTRYMLIESRQLGAFPTLGLGYRPANWLAVGVAFGWGIVHVDTSAMSQATGGTQPANDVLVRVVADDYFVPLVTASLFLTPFERLNVAVTFRYQDRIEAAGKATATTGLFTDALQPRETTLELPSVQQKLPWHLLMGVQARLSERMDVELDVQYEANSRNDAQRIDPTNGQAVAFEDRQGNLTTTMFPDVLRIEKRWRDQFSTRLGSSYGVLPDRLWVHAGVHYETRGQDPAYAQLDYFPYQRVGLHAGFTMRVGSVDVTLAYAHVFQESLTVAPPPHGDRTTGGFDKTAGNPASRAEMLAPLEEPPVRNANGTAALRQQVGVPSADDPAYIVNAGTYRTRFDILSLGTRLRF